MTENLSGEISVFAEDLKIYQKLCREIWEVREWAQNTDDYRKLLQKEEEQRESLVFRWGKLESTFNKMGIETLAVVHGRQFSIFEQGLESMSHSNVVKAESLSMAIQSAIKASGKIQSLNVEEFEFDLNSSLHPRIASGRCIRLFNDGHYPEAVENSFKIVRDRLRELTGFEKGSEAFGKGGLYIRGASAPHVDADFQQAVKLLTMSLDMFRNEKAHFADGNISNTNRAQEYINLSNLLMGLLDEAQVKKE